MTTLPQLTKQTALPSLIENTSEKSKKRFLEFFAVTIRNKNTRRAYYKGISQFLEWCNSLGVSLEQIEPMIVASYIEQLSLQKSPSTVKQRLAAIRMLFDWLVVVVKYFCTKPQELLLS